VASACAFGVKAMDRPPLHRRDRVSNKATFVQRVGMEGDLNVFLVGNRKAIVDRGGGGSPVLMKLEPDSAGANLLAQRLRLARIALAKQADIDRQRLDRL